MRRLVFSQVRARVAKPSIYPLPNLKKTQREPAARRWQIPPPQRAGVSTGQAGRRPSHVQLQRRRVAAAGRVSRIRPGGGARRGPAGLYEICCFVLHLRSMQPHAHAQAGGRGASAPTRTPPSKNTFVSSPSAHQIQTGRSRCCAPPAPRPTTRCTRGTRRGATSRRSRTACFEGGQGAGWGCLVGAAAAAATRCPRLFLLDSSLAAEFVAHCVTKAFVKNLLSLRAVSATFDRSTRCSFLPK